MPPDAKTKFQCSLADPFQASDLFSGLSLQEQRSLSDIRRTKQIRKGVAVFSPDDMPQGVYVLTGGNAQLFLNDESNRFFRLAEMNEVFGLTEAIAGQPFHMSLKTTTPCSFEFFAREEFLRFLQNDSAFCFHLVKLLGLNLMKSHKIIYSSII